MKVADLNGAALDYWVAKAEGHRVRVVDGDVVFYTGGDDTGLKERRGPRYSPSAEWSDGGPIIERERIAFVQLVEAFHKNLGRWEAHVDGYVAQGDLDGTACGFGQTQLIAAMRAYVVNKFGDEVPDRTDTD